MILNNINNKNIYTMNHLTSEELTVNIMPPEPVIRTLIIQSTPNKWLGCLYFSSYEMTGQMILFLKSQKGEYEGRLSGNPVYVLTGATKSSVDEKIIKKLQSILKHNKTE